MQSTNLYSHVKFEDAEDMIAAGCPVDVYVTEEGAQILLRGCNHTCYITDEDTGALTMPITKAVRSLYSLGATTYTIQNRTV